MLLHILCASTLLSLSAACWLSPPTQLPLPLLLASLISSLLLARRAPSHAAALATLCLTTSLLAASPPQTCALPLTSPSDTTIPALIIHDAAQLTPHGWTTRAHLPHDPSSTLILHLPADQWPTPPLPGDTLLRAFGKLSPPPPPLLPEHTPRSMLALRRRHLGSLSLAEPPDLSPPTHPSPSLSLRRALARRHTSLTLAIWALPIPAPHRALALAMTLGQRAMLDDDATRPLRRTGTAHILAISGLHIGALLLCLLTLARHLLCTLAPHHAARLGTARLAALPIAAAVSLYVALLGAPISALRAAIMILALLAALLLGRRPAPLTALSLAALILLLLDPSTPLDPAFWLSASATAAILIAWDARPAALRGPQRGVETRRRYHSRRLMALPYTSAAAWIGVAPTQLALSGQLPTIGLLLNPLLIPIISILAFPLLATGALLSICCPPLAALLIHAGGAIITTLSTLIAACADLPGATWTPGQPPWPIILAMAAASLIALRSTTPRLTLLAVALTIALPAAAQRWDHPPAGALRIHFIPVGQGDATLVQTPEGYTILVDAGGAAMGRDPGEHIVAPHLKLLGIPRLDAVILTHSDLDHMGGLAALAQHIQIDRFIYPADDPSASLTRLKDLMRRRGATLIPATHNALLTPSTRLLTPPGAHGNDASLLLSIHHAGLHALLLGDLEAAGERWLVTQHLGPVDLIKIPHHGSRTSSTPTLLAHTQPSVAVASAALHSRFGHPHPDVIDRYRRAGALTLRTDLHGLIRADLMQDGSLRLHAQRPAGPIPLILPLIARELWKTCHISDERAASTPH